MTTGPRRRFTIPRFTPLGILAAYVAAIVIFAFCFSLIPGDFHHSTVIKEKEVVSKLEKLKWEYYLFVRDVLFRDASYRGAGAEPVPEKLLFLFEEFEVTGREVRFKMDFNLELDSQTAALGAVTVVILHYKDVMGISRANENAFNIDDELERQFALAEVTADVRLGRFSGDAERIKQYIRRAFGNFLFEDSAQPYIRVPRQIWTSTMNYSDILSGSVKYLDSFPILLYLSTMTITTTGYGDIVPISGTARTLVALESIFGIILIGLFINSISTIVSKK